MKHYDILYCFLVANLTQLDFDFVEIFVVSINIHYKLKLCPIFFSQFSSAIVSFKKVVTAKSVITRYD